jgi:multiple antibiotic resistance protein
LTIQRYDVSRVTALAACNRIVRRSIVLCGIVLRGRVWVEIFHDGSGKKFIFDSQRVVSHCRSVRRKPDFSVHDAGVFGASSQGTFVANCHEQFFSAGGVVFYRDAYSARFFGLSIPIVQVGGGLIVVSNGWSLLTRGNYGQKEVAQTVVPQDPYRDAFYPLTLPLTVGPGSISVAITLGANAPYHQGLHLLSMFTALVGCVLLAASIYLCYSFADRLGRVLGTTGMTVILQLTSFLLVCIGVQILWNGASALLKSLPLGTH